MKSLSIFITLFIFAMSTAYAATLNVKMKKNTQWEKNQLN
jgi:hypothetical protein